MCQHWMVDKHLVNGLGLSYKHVTIRGFRRLITFNLPKILQTQSVVIQSAKLVTGTRLTNRSKRIIRTRINIQITTKYDVRIRFCCLQECHNRGVVICLLSAMGYTRIWSTLEVIVDYIDIAVVGVTNGIGIN